VPEQEIRAGHADQRERARLRGLLQKFARTRSPSLRDEIVVANASLVRFLAHRFSNRGESIDELFQVGMIGLIKAVDRFDPGRGVEFTTYATPTIVGEIKRYFRDTGWSVRVPRRLQELHVSLNKSLDAISADLGRPATVADLARRFGATEEEIIEAQELGHARSPISLQSEITSEGDGRHAPLGDIIGVEDPAFAALENRSDLQRSFGVLDRRERLIVHLRYFENMTQAQIARRLGISQMHVSRLQQRAVTKMRQFFAAAGAAS
jgi:RNA polymerase sigma-B factor